MLVAGCGIAGSLIAAGLRDEPGVEVTCLEKATTVDHADAGTGVNIGPNGIKSLSGFMPEQADALVKASLPWKRWTIALTSGEDLMDLDLSEVADNDGIRIRWAELYALLRGPLGDGVRYGAELESCGIAGDGRLTATWRDRTADAVERAEDIDLLIGGDGRYSKVRTAFSGDNPPMFLGVCLYRLLFPVGPDCPIDDYGQWFNGPNRLLAYRVPGDFVYLAGSFPIPADSGVPDAMKNAEALTAVYRPATGTPSREAGFLIGAIERHCDSIHWARLQEASILFRPAERVLLVGDAAHPMVPTLGQGATQAMEDACVVVDEVRRALREDRSLASVPAAVEQRRAERVRFVVDFSRDATDTMLAGADPHAGTLEKRDPPFQEKLKRLYRDVAMPG
ncbi:MAG: FAD-dependent monooxygenase [Bauldia sp.]|uniref:FAD-dependent oxidoreductase n=1 Tax=Bauldia sp. TaxID=2575872 RepID=UPI001DB12045|nr:NAD(P)/FAD-dependent oxidoreductase [Bauldia sp.]MCB1495450.1 FAD-dependent monooxygenase [Bauldia sp.]